MSVCLARAAYALLLVTFYGCPALGKTASPEVDGATLEARCLADAFPGTRSEFPAFLNCLGLLQDAVEVGVQAGVHAKAFLESWKGRRLRLVDKWWSPEDVEEVGSHLFYVDIANIHGAEIRKQHRAHCEARLSEELSSGRAEIVNLDSAAAASLIPDGELDFVYLDARHDFAGVCADIQAWWPKVRIGGIFAGHDFVDGEFPEGDFFWVSALRETLPGLDGHVHRTREKNRYPSFFIVKTPVVAGVAPHMVQSSTWARDLYWRGSKYFSLWRNITRDHLASAAEFVASCRGICGKDCDERARNFTPTRTAGSTLRPFACAPASGSAEVPSPPEGAADACAAELVVDVEAYHRVCLDRCNVTCHQRRELFAMLWRSHAAA